MWSGTTAEDLNKYEKELRLFYAEYHVPEL